jgi:hypothetical protein
MLILAKAGGGAVPPTMDTRENILALTPTNGDWAYATDTNTLYFGYSSAWHEAPIPWLTRSANPDMGVEEYASLQGYNLTEIIDKILYHCVVGYGDRAEEGGIRVSDGYLQCYLNGAWGDVVTGFRLREDDSGNMIFEHMPVGTTEWLEVMSGNSNTLGLNGLPMVQQYSWCMGPNPAALYINGGGF